MFHFDSNLAGINQGVVSEKAAHFFRAFVKDRRFPIRFGKFAPLV
jgi:hypothetical protein